MLGLDVVAQGASHALLHNGQLGKVAEDHQVKEGGSIAKEELFLAEHLRQHLQVVLRQLLNLLAGAGAEPVAFHHFHAALAEVVLEEKLEEGNVWRGLKARTNMEARSNP